jgi:hypothetical protein
MLHSACYTLHKWGRCARPGRQAVAYGGGLQLMELIPLLFAGFSPEEIFFRVVSVDTAELLVVLGTLLGSLGLMVIFGNWWSK